MTFTDPIPHFLQAGADGRQLLADREPRVRHIMTSNAETNAHMIGINEMLGYRVIGRTDRSWELTAAPLVEAQS